MAIQEEFGETYVLRGGGGSSKMAYLEAANTTF